MKHISLLVLAFAAVGCDSSDEVQSQAYAVKHEKRSCGTRDLSDAEKEKVDGQVAQKQGGGGGGTTGTGGAIDVYFHVIKASNGQGAVTSAMIASQVDVLNDAYAS